MIEQDYDEVDWEEFPNLVEYTFKVILCGDAAVGKTSFLNQLCLGEFRESTIATIGWFFLQTWIFRKNGFDFFINSPKQAVTKKFDATS